MTDRIIPQDPSFLAWFPAFPRCRPEKLSHGQITRILLRSRSQASKLTGIGLISWVFKGLKFRSCYLERQVAHAFVKELFTVYLKFKSARHRPVVCKSRQPRDARPTRWTLAFRSCIYRGCWSSRSVN